MPTLVVGAGGLLGSAVARRLVASGLPVATVTVPWTDTARARTALHDAVDALLARVGPDGRWRVAWCAGAGVTGSSPADFARELDTFQHFLSVLGARAHGTRGRLFVASSAGGLYAGSSGAPFSEHHPVTPLAPYGHAKLDSERIARGFGLGHGHEVVIGRIANLYGPGQDLRKGQGLISHLCLAHLQRRPVSLFVSLDTIRDYLWVEDCAAMVEQILTRPDSPGVTVKILATGQGITIAALLGECRRLFKKAPLVILGASRSSQFQVKDLRLRSRVWTEIDRRPFMPLAAGIGRTMQDLRGQLAVAG